MLERRAKRPPEFFSFYLKGKFKKNETKYLSVKQLQEELSKKGLETSKDCVRNALKRYKIPGTPSEIDGRLAHIYKTTELQNHFKRILEDWKEKVQQN